MRDEGLDEAIRVAGGVGALARKIGISQPSVSNWARIPAERVLSVEVATGVSRTILRPDLYGNGAASEGVDDLDAGRAQEYSLLSALLARAPDRALLERLATLRGDASPLGLAHAALAEAASRTTSERVEREYFDLFIGLGRGELLPYGSYYLTGFLHERPLARLRTDLDKLGIERAHIDLVFIDGDAAIVRAAAIGRDGSHLVLVVPVLLAGLGVDGINVIKRRRDVHHAVDHDRRRLERFLQFRLEDPGRMKLVHIRRVDLLAGKIARLIVIAIGMKKVFVVSGGAVELLLRHHRCWRFRDDRRRG